MGTTNSYKVGSSVVFIMLLCATSKVFQNEGIRNIEYLKRSVCYTGYIENVRKNFTIYRVSIKSFPDYKHLLQENYCKWNTNIFYHCLNEFQKCYAMCLLLCQCCIIC